MLAYGVTESQLANVARATGVRIIEARGAGGRGLRFRLGLEPGRKYGRRSASGSGRRVAAVCWHGHREFFRELFKAVPGARVQTASTRAFERGHRFYTADTFEDVFRSTDRNVGSIMAPMRYSDACDCGTPIVQGGKFGGVRFATLDRGPGGSLVETKIRTIKHADLRRCPFTILVPDHYREDGSCKCDDARERERMIAEWEYTPEDFTRPGVPELRNDADHIYND